MRQSLSAKADYASKKQTADECFVRFQGYGKNHQIRL
jgi:hypothetical protein